MYNIEDNPLLSQQLCGEVLINVWESLPEDEKELLSEQGLVKHFSRGEYVYRNGDTPRYIMFLRRGRIKVVKDGVAGGRQQIVRVLRPVEMFGYRAYFAEEPYSTSCVAIDDCDVVHFPMTAVMSILEHNLDISKFLLSQLSKELGSSENRIVSLTQKHVRGRLAEALLLIEDRCGLDSDGLLDVKLSREEIACFAGMTTSNAIRTLSAFAQEGIVELIGKRIVLTNHEALEEISRMG